MPTKIEKDSVTGHTTTGHEWDGLKELNRPLPKWWLYIMYGTIVWAIGWCIMYPSFPGLTGYWHGVLGYSARGKAEADVAAVAALRAGAMDRIAALTFDQIKADPELLAVAETAGRITFANNCQPCHGAGGGGNPGYPALAAGNWIWGGTLAAIQKTVTHGIRSADPDARTSQMPAFGTGGILKPEEIQQVADYVATLFGVAPVNPDVAPGKALFAADCAICHGEAGQGNRDMGAPRLASKAHLYGDTRAAIVAQVTNPRAGVMPNWNTRLDAGMIKSVTLYVHALGGGE